MELDAAVQIACHACQALQPAVEARLELSARGYGHLYAAQRVQGLHKAREHNLAVQTVIQALQEFAPELGIDIRVHVHTHDNL